MSTGKKRDGVIFKAISGFYYVENGDETAVCRAPGRFRLENITPLVGDRVRFTDDGAGQGVLSEIMERKNAFIRPPIANIDQLVIVASGALPVTDPFLIDRMTVTAEKNRCDVVVCINKADMDSADPLFDIYAKSGFITIRTSAETGEGIAALASVIKGKISAFTGNSGVGKSSILNMLDPNIHLSVGEISYKLGRGRHTTRHVELYKLGGGTLVADTPGFSAFATEQIERKEDVQFLFRDFEKYLGQCRFRDCAHIKEIGCAVLDAVARGEIQKSRHDSYVRLYEQVKDLKNGKRIK